MTMMHNLTFEKIRKAASRSFAMALAFVVTFTTAGTIFGDTSTLTAEALEQGSAYYYHWHRINSDAELAKYAPQIASDTDSGKSMSPQGQFKVNPATHEIDPYRSETEWQRAMFVYGDGGAATYMLAKGTYSYDYGSFYGNSVPDLPFDSNEFTTFSNYKCPYIKFAGLDKDNANDRQYFIRFPANSSYEYWQENDGKKPYYEGYMKDDVNYYWLYHQNNLWGGASSSDYDYAVCDGPGIYQHADDLSDHWYFNNDPTRSVKFSFDCRDNNGDPGYYQIYNNIKHSGDVCMRHEGQEVWASTLQSYKASKTIWRVYVAEAEERPCLSTDYTVTGSEVISGTMIKQDVTFTVTGDLTLKEKVTNNGRIIVKDGGILIIDSGAVLSSDKEAYGSKGWTGIVEIQKGGQMIVMPNALVYQSEHPIPSTANSIVAAAIAAKGQNLVVNEGGSIYNMGRIVLSDNLIVNGGQLICVDNGYIEIGKALNHGEAYGSSASNLDEWNKNRSLQLLGQWQVYAAPKKIEVVDGNYEDPAVIWTTDQTSNSPKEARFAAQAAVDKLVGSFEIFNSQQVH